MESSKNNVGFRAQGLLESRGPNGMPLNMIWTHDHCNLGSRGWGYYACIGESDGKDMEHEKELGLRRGKNYRRCSSFLLL